MQKKIIVLAIAGAISSIAAGSAFAADASVAPSVSFYGLLDYGFVNQGGNSGAVNTSPTSSFNSGISEGSRIGVKGGKDLASGYKFIYELEYGITIDNNGQGSNSPNVPTMTTGTNNTVSSNTNQSSPFWNRHSYVGVTGEAGTFVGGRVEGARYSFQNKYDPFAGGTVGNFGSLLGHQARADNAVAYISPTVAGGFSVLVAYTNRLGGDELATENGDARLYAIAPQYNNGPLSITYDFEDAFVHGTGDNIAINVLGASYDASVVKLFGYWESVKTTGALLALNAPSLNVNQTAYMVGATVPAGSSATLKVSYGTVKDGFTSNNDCSKAAIGADYKADKNLTLYADFASISNQTNASCTITTSSSNYSGSKPGFEGVDSTFSGNANGQGTTGIDIGAKFTF